MRERRRRSSKIMRRRKRGDWGGHLLALEATEILNQYYEADGTTLVDACNGFNGLSRLLMLWKVHHRWPAGERFVLNLYRHWEQLLLYQSGDAPVILLSQEGVTKGDPLSMLLYGITITPLEEDMRDADPTLLSPFNADDAAFDGSERRSAAQLKLLTEQGPERGNLPEPARSLFIVDNPEEKEAEKREFERAGLNLNYVDGGRYLGAYLGPREDLEEWVRTKVEVWTHGVRTLSKISKRYPKSAYAGLGMSP